MTARIRVKVSNPAVIGRIMRSGELAAQLEPLADQVLQAAKQDPNEEFVKSLRKRMFVSSGRSARVSWQVGAAPWAIAVEAVRGTMARALGRVG